MSLTDDLRTSVGPLWDMTVAHPFVIELGDGTLPPDVFDIYFQQDHLFIRDWIALMCAGVAKAPDFDAARPLAAFIHLALGAKKACSRSISRRRDYLTRKSSPWSTCPQC